METPFVFGKIATEKNFTDREQETAYLVDNFVHMCKKRSVSCETDLFFYLDLM